jgi:hypothetical protein
MTRKSRREIERALADAREEITPDPEVTIISGGVTVVTSDTVDDTRPDPDPPDGYENGREIPTDSPVVTWRELIPVDDAADTDR